jgi:hypothetical protein
MGEGSAFSLWLPADVSAAESARVEEVPVDAPDTENGPPPPSPPPAARREVRGLADVARGLLSQLAPLVEVMVERLRSDPTLPMAAGLRTSQVSDHLPTLLADIAGALIIVEEAAGEPSSMLAGAMEIQRLVAEQHGAQRARLGWREASMRREFMIIREELERVVRRSVSTQGVPHPVDAVAAVNRFVDQAEFIAVRALEKARED